MSRTLRIWIPSNRVNPQMRLTHMDGWNEIKKAFENRREIGSKLICDDVQHCAQHIRLAMLRAHWLPMDKYSARPCKVTLRFVERDHRRDLGNIHGGSKYALDALTVRHRYGAGAIYDDSQKWLKEVIYDVAYVGEGYDEPGLEIIVTTLEKLREKH